MTVLYIIRYGEIGIKAERARKRFERQLVRNITRALVSKAIEHEFSFDRGRIFLYSTEDIDNILVYIPGIVSFSKSIQCAATMEDIKNCTVSVAKEHIHPGESFALRVRRRGSHTFSSMDVAKLVGAAILDTLGNKNVKVDLTNPDKEIHIEIRNKNAYIFTEIIHGAGGLPIGTQGPAICLVSNMADAHASVDIIKRGITPFFVLNIGLEDGIIEYLSQWLLGFDLSQHIIMETELSYSPYDGYSYETYKFACEIAKRYNACAVVSGETLATLLKKKEFMCGKWCLDVPVFFPNVCSKFA